MAVYEIPSTRVLGYVYPLGCIPLAANRPLRYDGTIALRHDFPIEYIHSILAFLCIPDPTHMRLQSSEAIAFGESYRGSLLGPLVRLRVPSTFLNFPLTLINSIGRGGKMVSFW